MLLGSRLSLAGSRDVFLDQPAVLRPPSSETGWRATAGFPPVTPMRNASPDTLKDNVFKLISRDWMLITAGDRTKFNTMTASWAGLGYLWDQPVSFCFVRPQRYTFEFMEKSAGYTLSFFPEQYREALSLCGSQSGRDIDKVQATGLTPAFTENGLPYFAEARLVLECRKLYARFLEEEGFHDTTIPAEVYPDKDFHRLYIGGIVQCLVE
jgi:flavin reductase (DIM6/NTAB) family NADH-FMN oxidoreductase RutF